jgi:hypothetical protein
VPGLDVAASNRDRGCKACCLVLYPAAAYACVRRRPVLRCTTLLLGTVVCTEECLSGLQGQPCLARADSMPPAGMPNHSHGSISHSPPQSHLLLGSHPDQQYLRTTCRRPGIKLSECECECECGALGVGCCGSSGKGTLDGCIAPFWTVLHSDEHTNVVWCCGPVAETRDVVCVFVRARVRVRACVPACILHTMPSGGYEGEKVCQSHPAQQCRRVGKKAVSVPRIHRHSRAVQ